MISFRGLSNQGATCYMNSLLQTLFMTPEFRKAIFSWTYNPEIHGPKHENILFQLQSLFASLQLSPLSSVETKALTTSFGWTGNEVFQQHDVQELCRVLFNAIEETTRNSEFIDNLYQGIYSDYVKCLTCCRESTKETPFLDINLTIRNDFEQVYNSSLEDAFTQFVKAEQLDGPNQYFCENCGSKQDALKGLRFSKFPYILAIQLNRFTLDYETMQRIKINDTVTFPSDLNLDSFLHGAGEYELFSIMIHSGSAGGGHYFAYIKSFQNDAWFEFNDESVRPLAEDEFLQAFGSPDSCTNAYFLMYRKKSPDNVLMVEDTEIAEAAYKEAQEQIDKLKQEEFERMELLKQITLSVYLNRESKQIKIDKTLPLEEIKLLFLLEFGREEDLANVRLREYNSKLDFKKDVIYNMALQKDNSKVAIEIKMHDQKFESFDPHEIIVKVHQFKDELQNDPNAFEIMKTNPIIVHLNTLGEFSQITNEVQRLTGLPEHEQKYYISKKNQNSSSLQPIQELNSSITLGKSLYLETNDSQKWKKIFENENNKITLYFNSLSEIPDYYDNYRFTKSLRISQNKTLWELKLAIAKKLDIDVESLVIKKGFRTGYEYININQPIRESGIFDKNKIFAGVGKPNCQGMVRCKFYLATMLLPDESDNEIHEFKKIESKSYPETYSVWQLKVEVCQILKQRKSIQITPNQIKLRELLSNRLGRDFYDHEPIKTYSLFSDKKIGIQILDSENKASKSNIFIYAKHWKPIDNRFDAVLEIEIPKSSSIASIGDMLAARLNIPVEQLEIFRSEISSFSRSDLSNNKFRRTFGDTRTLDSENYSDGVLLIVIDNSDQGIPRLATPVKNSKPKQSVDTPFGSNYSTDSSRSRAPPKESGIIIQVRTPERNI